MGVAVKLEPTVERVRARSRPQDADRRQVGRGRVGQDVRDRRTPPTARCWPSRRGRRRGHRPRREGRAARLRRGPVGAHASPSDARAPAAQARRPDREAHGKELAQLETLDNGKPLFETPNVDIPLVVEHVPLLRRLGDQDHGRDEPVRSRLLQLHAARAGRRLRPDHPVELPAADGGVEARPGARVRQHRRAQARRADAAHGAAPRRAAPGGGRARRASSTSCPGFGETAGARARPPSAIDKVAFTGSTEVGKEIIASRAGTLKRVSLELGGKSPEHRLRRRRHVEAAVQGALIGVFFNQGQVCCAGHAALRRGEAARRVRRRARRSAAQRHEAGARAGARRAGGPAGVSKEQLERVTGYLDVGKKEGAKAAHRRRAQHGEGPREGLLRQADGLHRRQERHAHRAGGDLRTGGLRDPVQGRERRRPRRATTRSTASPPASGRATSRKAHRVARALKAGTVWVNCYNVFDAAAPFGGYKQSGFGRELGELRARPLHAGEERLAQGLTWPAFAPSRTSPTS